MVGMAPANINPNSFNYTTCGYYIYSGNGQLYSMKGDIGKPYHGKQIGVNSVIQVHYTPTSQSIHFVIDGTVLPVAFTGVGDVYPCVDFFGQDESVRIESIGIL